MSVHSAVGFACLFLFFVVAHGATGQASNNSLVYGGGFTGVPGFSTPNVITVNVTYTFYIQAVDSDGNNVTVGGANFAVSFAFLSPNWTLTDNMDGTYTVNYLLEPVPENLESNFAIQVKLDGIRLAKSAILWVTFPYCLVPPYCAEIYPITTTTGSLDSATTGPVSTTDPAASTTTGPDSTTGPASLTTGSDLTTTTGPATTTGGVGPVVNISLVYGEGFYGVPGFSVGGVIAVNTTYTFYIQAVDSNGNNITVGGDDYTILWAFLTPIWTLTDNMDGTYTVSYLLEPTAQNTNNLFAIRVQLDGRKVAQSVYLWVTSPECLEPPYPCPEISPITEGDSESENVVPIVAPISVVVGLGVLVSACVVFRKKRTARMRWVAMDQHMRRSGSSMRDAEMSKLSPNLQRLFSLNDPSFVLKVQTPALNFNAESGRLCPVGKSISHDFSITNTSVHSQHFVLQGSETDKFTISFSPSSGDIKKGETIKIRAILFFKCTTRVTTEVLLAVLDTGHVLLPLDVESELSTRIDVDEIALEETPIGEGGFGVVYRAQWRGMEVAVKTIKASFSGVARLKFEEECDMIAKLRHPNIINFVGAVISPSMIAMVTEYCPKGNLYSLVKSTYLSYGLQVKLLLDIAKGMDFLHTSGILHRDLKSDNVLVLSTNPDSPICAKISDFGSSRTYDPANSHEVTGGIGTPSHMAPELLRRQGYTDKADVYSYAIVMYEVCTRMEPYNPTEFPMAWDIASFVVAGKRLEIPPTTDPRAAGLIRRCWSEDPTTRPDFGEIIYILSIMSGEAVMPSLVPRKPLNLFIPPPITTSNQSAHTPFLFFPREGHDEPTLRFPSNSSTDSSNSEALKDSSCESSGLPQSDSKESPSSNAAHITPSDFIFSEDTKEESITAHIKLPNTANTSLNNYLNTSTISISIANDQ